MRLKMKYVKMTKIFLISLMFVSISEIVLPQDGELDPAFGQGGITTASIYSKGNSEINSIVIQNDGKILAAGFTTINETFFRFSIVRYNNDGTMDNTFGTNGIVNTNIGDVAFANSIALQIDGKIILAGYSSAEGINNMAVVRYNTDGSIDSSFGNKGIVLKSIGANSVTLTSTKIQKDGKILAAGHYFNGSNEDFFLSRFNTDGTYDTDFGHDGIVITQVGASYDYAYSMIVQNDGKIILAGSGFQTNDDFALVRYNSDGIIDNTFGINGKVFTQVGASTDVAKSVLLQDDGKVIAAGYSFGGANFDFSIARYDTNGFLDDSFGTLGRTITNVGITNDYAYSAAIKNNGKIVLAGYSYNKNDYDIAIVQYNSDGIIDSSFGTNGIVTTPVGAYNDYAYSTAIQSNGNILAAGYSESNSIHSSIDKSSAVKKSEAGSYHNFTLVSYNSDGTLDESFADSGIQLSQVGESYTSCSSAAIQNSGKIIVAGSFTSPASMGIARFNTDGTIDNSFLDHGSQTSTFVGSIYSTFTSVKIQNDNKIVLGGYTYSNNNKSSFVISRADPDGFPDPDFGTNGYTITTMDSSVAVQSLALQNDDKIIAVGNSFSDGEVHFVLTRYNTAGNLDSTFGIDGIVITPSLTGHKHDYSASVLLQNNNKIIAVGNASNTNENNFALVRYKTDGSIDSTFGNNGIVLTPFESQNVYLNSAILQSDGKIIAAGYMQKSTEYDFVAVRYKADGNLDNTFGANGVFSLGTPNFYEECNSIVIQDDGKIILAGESVNGNSNIQNIKLVRLNTDGSLDNTFGTGGIKQTTIGSSYSETSSVLMQSDGKIVVAGNIGNSNFYSALTLIRYNNKPGIPSAIEVKLNTPIKFSLSQNYPNPFNPSTIIKYSLPKQSYVTLKVYDILGKEVRSLVDEEKPAGNYQVEFYAADLPSGVYFYRVQAGSFNQVRKMLLIK